MILIQPGVQGRKSNVQSLRFRELGKTNMGKDNELLHLHGILHSAVSGDLSNNCYDN